MKEKAKSLNVLNVEDSVDDYALILRHLKKGGYEVYSERVETAETMRAALASRDWDIIISDYRMPNFSGLEAFYVFKESGRDIPFIIISGTIGEETAVQAMLTGVNDYMMKNNLSRLVPAIERELQEATNRRARTKAEEDIRKSEEKFRSLVTSTSQIVWTADAEGNLTDAHSPHDLLTTSNGNTLMTEWVKRLHPEDSERAQKNFWNAIQRQTDYRDEYRLLHLDDNTYHYYVARGTPVFEKDGTIREWVGALTDITERKLAENSLRESEENFRALAIATTQIVWTMNSVGSNDEFPRWWKDLTGQTAEDAADWGWFNAIHPDDRARARALWDKAINNIETFDSEYRVLTKDNEYRHYAVRGVPIINSDGSFRQWIGTFTDITENKRAEQALRESEEQLRQAQKLESIGRLAGGVAHDFNNMLTAINGYSDLTLRSLPPNDPLRKNIEEIKKAGERSAALTRQLLAFSRRQMLQERLLDINEVIFETSGMLKRVIGENYHLVTALAEDVGKIKADPGQLSQVLMNLVVNSSDAMPDGGHITIETKNVDLDEAYAQQHISVIAGAYVQLAVSDTGTGIDEHTQKHIFEPFFTTKEVGKGTGLGLSTVYGIIKQSGGNVWVYSELGKGTTFKIYFPRVEDKVVPEKHSYSTGLKTGSETILLVEDEELVRTLSRDTLELCGYNVIEATNGIEALNICEKEDLKIDLLLTDVVMPQMGGRELAEKLSGKYPGMKVLFTSGYTDDAVVRHGIIAEGTNFIQKPFTLDSLAQKIREALDS